MTDGIIRGWARLKGLFDRVLGGIGSAFETLHERIKKPIEDLKWALDKADEAGRAIEGFMSRATGAGRPSGGTTAPGWADVIAPPTAELQSGLAGGTAGIRVQGNADAEAYGEGFSEGMGIRSPSRVMMGFGRFMAGASGSASRMASRSSRAPATGSGSPWPAASCPI